MKKIIGFFSITALLLFLAPEPKVEGQIGYQITASQVAAATNITYTAPVAGTGTDTWAMAQTLLAMNGSDTVRGLFIDLTNADHTGSGNVLYGLDIDNITGDAQAVEYAINIGSGWDAQIHFFPNSSIVTYTQKVTFGEESDASNAAFVLNRFPRNVAFYTDTFLVGVGDGTDAIAAMDGSDTYAMLSIDFTNANHTGSSNLLYGLDIDGITQDAEGYESAVNLGAGWDMHITFYETGQTPEENPPAGAVGMFLDDNADYSGGGGNDCVLAVIDASGNITILATITTNGACP